MTSDFIVINIQYDRCQSKVIALEIYATADGEGRKFLVQREYVLGALKYGLVFEIKPDWYHLQGQFAQLCLCWVDEQPYLRIHVSQMVNALDFTPADVLDGWLA